MYNNRNIINEKTEERIHMKFIKTPVKGMCDMLPSDMRLREHIFAMIRETYAT